MKEITYILIIGFYSNVIFSQISVTDSILISQNNTLKAICKEINDLGSEIAKIDSTRFSTPLLNKSSSDTTIVKIGNNIEANLNEKKCFWDLMYKSFGHIISALTTLFVGLWVFYGRWKKEIEKDEEQRLTRLTEKNDYLKSIIHKVIDLSEKYENSISKFRVELENDPFKIPEIDLYPLQEYNRLQKIIENEEYYHAFLNKFGNSQENIDRFRNIASISDYLESQTKEFLKIDYRLDDHKRKIDYSSLLRETMEDTTELGMKYLTTHPQLNLDLQQILTNYAMLRQNIEDSDLSITQNNFVEQLTSYFIQDVYFVLPDVRMILNKLSKMSDIYFEIPQQNIHTSQRFEFFQETINKVIKKLKEETEIIRNESSD